MSDIYHNSVFGQIDSLIAEINGATVKTAATKLADDESAGSGSASDDPGGYKGKSTHPSAKADGGLHAAPTGARSSENVEDVKKFIPVNVETVGNGGEGGDLHVQIGTKKSLTGEDPSTEDAYKPSKDDPGTSAPANAEDIGEKYASYSFPLLYKEACSRIEDLLSRLAAGQSVEKVAAVNAPSVNGQSAGNAHQAAQAGYELSQLAASLGQAPDESVVKFAMAQDVVQAVLQSGWDEADLVGEYLYKTAAYEEQLRKQAEGEPLPPELTGGGMGGGEGMPGGMGGMMPGGPGGPGGMPGGEGPPVDPAGAPPELGGAGGLPGGEGGLPGGEGGLPGGEGAPGGGGGPGGDDAVNEMANALIESGLPVDKLIAALQAHAGGEGEKTAMAAGIDKPTIYSLHKLASDCRNLMASGRFRLCGPRSKQAQADREEAKQYLNYVREVLSIR